MANPHQGEVAADIGGKSYKLAFSSNALCELEDALDRNVNVIAQSMQDPQKIRMRDLRVIFWAALLDHQPDTTIDDAKVLMSKIGPPELMDLLGKVFVMAFPRPETAAADQLSPPKPVEPAAGGTGSAS